MLKVQGQLLDRTYLHHWAATLGMTDLLERADGCGSHLTTIRRIFGTARSRSTYARFRISGTRIAHPHPKRAHTPYSPRSGARRIRTSLCHARKNLSFLPGGNFEARWRSLMIGSTTLHKPQVQRHQPIDLTTPRAVNAVYVAPAAFHAALQPASTELCRRGHRRGRDRRHMKLWRGESSCDPAHRRCRRDLGPRTRGAHPGRRWDLRPLQVSGPG